MCKFLISSISLVYLLLIKSTLVLTLMKEAAIGIYMDEKKHFLQLAQQILVSLSIQTTVNTYENGIIDSCSCFFQLGSGERNGSKSKIFWGFVMLWTISTSLCVHLKEGWWSFYLFCFVFGNAVYFLRKQRLHVDCRCAIIALALLSSFLFIGVWRDAW